MRRRLRYIQLAAETCHACHGRFMSDNRLEIHHMDQDRQNNATSNLVILCIYCHRRVHYPDSEWRCGAVVELRQSGLSFQQIAKTLAISRQRCHQIYKMVTLCPK